MDQVGAVDELSTVNGYVAQQSGSPGSTTIAGGPARTLNGSSQDFSGTADANICGVGTPFSKAVAFRLNSLAGNPFIYGCLDAGFGTQWRVQIVSADSSIRILIGNPFDTYILATGISTGVTYAVSFSYDPATKLLRAFVNDGSVITFAAGTTNPAGAADKFYIGGTAVGLLADGAIAAPTGWTRVLPDSEQLLWFNS